MFHKSQKSKVKSQKSKVKSQKPKVKRLQLVIDTFAFYLLPFALDAQ